jgi:hypothetical protein
MAWHRRPTPGNWATIKATVMTAHNGVCHVCGHGQADQCDHLGHADKLSVILGCGVG